MTATDPTRNGIEEQNCYQFQPHGFAFRAGQRVRKIKGSSWQGKVVGFYNTDLTPVGYCVESEREPGSVQVYGESALEKCS